MATDLCANGAFDNAKYSSPMPVIGLYIAGATLVCFLSMVYDIWKGIRRRKPWLPCHFFSLNSLTLTLLSIATKLPVDLTTSMPSAQDQLSKLSGTALICISMGFLMPSLGSMGDSEGFANMASLTILVVAVVVNVCIQMATGVIFSFIVEHVIILFFMLVLLAVLWSSMSTINFEKTICTDRTKELLRKGGTQEQSSDNSMIQRLKLCYVHSYSSNPQLILFQTSHCATIGILCILCSVVLLEAVLRSFGLKELKFCKQVSDYRWSMMIVVVTQILHVLLGSVAIGFRWLTFVSHLNRWIPSEVDNMFLRSSGYDAQTLILHYGEIWVSKTIFVKIFRLLEFLVRSIVVLMQGGLYMMSARVLWSSFKVREFFAWAMRNTKNCYSDGESTNTMTKEFQDVFLSAEKGLEEWLLRIDVKDMERWIVVVKKNDSPNLLIQLLLKTPPSEQSLVNDIKIVGQHHKPPKELEKYFFGNYRVSCLSIVVLALVTAISIPSTLSGSLINTLDEVFEIIYFIDKKMNTVSLGNKLTWMLAKDVWMYRDIIIGWFQKENSNVNELDRALGIVNKIREYKFTFLDAEVKIITSFIKNRAYTSIGDLYNHIERVFVDMLHSFLINLPSAIFKDVVESSAEECEERVRHAMKFLYKLELLDAKVQWLFPHETNITSLLASTTDTRHSTQMERGDVIVALRVNEDVGDNIPTTCDVSIQEIV